MGKQRVMIMLGLFFCIMLLFALFIGAKAEELRLPATHSGVVTLDKGVELKTERKSTDSLFLQVINYERLWDVVKKAVAERRLPVVATQGAVILLIGVFCPLFWIALFKGASVKELLFHATHSAVVALIGLAIMIIGLLQE